MTGRVIQPFRQQRPRPVVQSPFCDPAQQVVVEPRPGSGGAKGGSALPTWSASSRSIPFRQPEGRGSASAEVEDKAGFPSPNSKPAGRSSSDLVSDCSPPISPLAPPPAHPVSPNPPRPRPATHSTSEPHELIQQGGSHKVTGHHYPSTYRQRPDRGLRWP